MPLANSARASHQQSVQAFIGGGSVVTGDISFSQFLRVEGVIRGRIFGGRLFVLMGEGQLQGEISADEVYLLGGSVEGQVVARKVIEVGDGVHVKGDLRAPAIKLSPLAVLDGECHLADT